MNKSEMFQALKNGHKVTHRFFTSDEYLFMKDGIVYTEDGYKVTPEFWSLRKDSNWDQDWKIYESK